MRLRRLDLLAFGPFTDRSLDLSREPSALTIVLGENEAGKSTSLRALEGLLFGIEARTQDAHTHPYGELRVGGLLESASGELLDIVRRKGIKGTLRDREGNPIDDAKLRALLRGVDLEAFRALYGLDHESLRLGADALEKAQGKVGESLFDAGLGGLGVGQAIQAFAEEADELFSPLARKKPLNEAIRSLMETRKEVRIEATNPEALPDQERAIEDARSTAREAEVERRALLAERQKLRRVTAVASGLEARARLVAAKDAMGDVPRLPENAATLRAQAVADRAEALAKIARIEEELGRHRDRLAAIDAPRALLDATPVVDRLREHIGPLQASITERPALESELARLDQRRAELSMRIGAALGEVLDPSVAGKVAELAVERDGAALRLREAEARVSELVRERARLEAELASLPPARDATRLVALIDEAASASELPNQIARDEAELDLAAARADAALASLGLFAGTLAELVRLPVPPLELVASADRARRERAEQQRIAWERIAEAEERHRERTRDLEALLSVGTLPSEDELAEARRSRDAELERLDHAPEQERGTSVLHKRIAEADAIADRLRREAARVERHAQLGAAQSEAARAKLDARARAATLADEEIREAEAFRAAFLPAGIEPLAPSEMLSWLERRRAAVELHLELERRRERLLASKRRLESSIAALEAATVEHGAEPHDGGAPPSLVAALSAARSLVMGMERARVRREGLAASLAECREKADRAEAEVERFVRGAAVSAARWTEAMRALGLDEHATVAAANARASDLAELSRTDEERARLSATLGRIEERAEELGRLLSQLEAECGPELGLPPSDASPIARAVAIARRHSEAREGEIERQGIGERLSALEANATDERGRLARAEAKLAELVRAAGVPEDRLPEAEAMSAEAARLHREIEAVEQLIRARGDGLSFDELEVERASVLGIDLAVRLDELDLEIDACEARRDRAHHDVGAREEGLRKLEREAKAADLAVLAEGHLARAAVLLRRYAIARLAKEVLEREVERYRASHQGPILERAEVLLRRLTLGRYEHLRVVYGDSAPELRCVRGGREVEVVGLSDGTRDQLFLALRLATLERHASYGEPMPLVLDDVFVHFDDERTRAGLEVLAELSKTLQVVLFTHHARVVELAQRSPSIAFSLERL